MTLLETMSDRPRSGPAVLPTAEPLGDLGPGGFDYQRAFARNLGLLNGAGQQRLRALRVGLPGLGGVGGLHLQTLARLGIESFHLADPDRFELPNLNRQFGAFLSSVGQAKAGAAEQTLRDINPRIRSRIFPEGLHEGNLAAFLDGVEVVVDGIEAFRIEVRQMLYAACRRRGIPVINAGPLGYGAALIIFTPQGEDFESYFGLQPGMTRAEKLAAFFLGMMPWIPGEVDPAYVDFEREKGPALSSACTLCAGMAATELVKWATGRGALAVPGRGVYIDPLRLRAVRIRRKPRLRSLAGRALRWLAFRRFPGLRRLHEQELSALRLKS